MSPSWRSGTAAPLGIGALVGLLVGVVGWSALVDHDAASIPGKLRLVIFAVGGAGAVTFLVARRLLRGPGIVRHSWLLDVAPMPAQVPVVAELVARLERHGYRLQVVGVSLDGTLEGAAPAPGTALTGAAFGLIDARLGTPPACLIVRLGGSAEGSNGLGMIMARDRRGRGYHELAEYVLMELDGLAPGLEFKPDDSNLSGAPASMLRGALPARPRALGPS